MSRSGFAWSRLIPLLVASSSLFAQGVNAQVSGKVISTGGQAISGAKVTLRQIETGFTRQVNTDGAGRFVAVSLPVGAYTITVERSGFHTISNVRTQLNLGDAAPLNIKMAPESGAVVEVVAQNAKVDTERTSTATLLTPESLENLPVAGRKWESFAFLTPQVTTSSRGDLAIAGQRGVNTAIAVDGANYNSSFFGGTLGQEAGGTPFTLSSEAIREFQVVTDGASAEFGRMGGGYLNAITKTGTNDFTGSLFYYQRPQSMVAKRHIDGKEVADFSNKQYGFSVGGPILKDKLFYFAVVDLQRDSRPNPVVFGKSLLEPAVLDPAKASDRAFLNRQQGYTVRNDQTSVMFSLNYVVNANHTVNFRVNNSSFSGDNGQGSNVAYDSTSKEEGKTLSLLGQWNWIIGSNLINEFKVSYLKESLPRTRRSDIPQVTVTNVGRYGESLFNREFETKDTQFTNNLTWFTPTLQVKAGFDVVMHNVFETFTPRGGGVYTFNNLADFQAGNWNRYEQFFSLQPGVSLEQAGTMDEKEKELAAYIQADWKPTDQFKLGLGLRWDRQEHPTFGIADFTGNPAGFSRPGPLTGRIPSDNTISPRLSFTYTPAFDQGHTVIRGSIGTFVSRTPSVFTYQVLTSNGSRAALYRFTSVSAAMAAAYPNFVRGASFNYENPYQLPEFNGTVFGTGSAPDVQTFSPDFKNPRTNKGTLEVQRAFQSGFTVSASVTASRTTNLERITDLNLGTPVLTAGRWVYPTTRPNANYRTMQVYLSDAEATYRALVVSAEYTPKESPVTGRLSYTYAQEKDNDSNERSFSGVSSQDPNRLGDDWSWSANDRRHVITGYLNVYDKWFSHVNFGFNLRYLGGQAYNPVFSGADLNRDGNNNDRPLGMERNSFREPGRTIVDLKVSRDWKLGEKIRLQGSAEVFNLFNKTTRMVRTLNFQGNDTAYTPTLSNTWTLSTERSVQLGARLSF